MGVALIICAIILFSDLHAKYRMAGFKGRFDLNMHGPYLLSLNFPRL